MTCTVCHHPQRTAIDAAIVAGTAIRTIVSQFSVRSAAIQRHALEHITQEIGQSQEEPQGLDVVRQLKEMNGVTLALLEEIRANKMQPSLVLQVIDRVMKQLELQAKLLGDINDAPQVNIWTSPDWFAIRSTIVQSLNPFPEARVAVAEALMEKSRELSTKSNGQAEHTLDWAVIRRG